MVSGEEVSGVLVMEYDRSFALVLAVLVLIRPGMDDVDAVREAEVGCSPGVKLTLILEGILRYCQLARSLVGVCDTTSKASSRGPYNQR